MEKRKDKNTHAASAVVGGMISLACVILACFLLTAMITNEVLMEKPLPWPTILITVLAAAIGAIYTSIKAKENVLLWCICQGAVFFLLLIGINAILFDGMYARVGTTVVSIVAAVSVIAILYSITKQRKGNGRKRR